MECFAQINRNERLLSKKNPKIVLLFSTQAMFERALIAAKTHVNLLLVTIDTSLSRYEPFLAKLQAMREFPLSDQLVAFENLDAPPPASPGIVDIVTGCRTRTTELPIALEHEDLEAMLAGLAQKVGVVSTGKKELS